MESDGQVLTTDNPEHSVATQDFAPKSVLPPILLVTPALNNVRYIEQTIQSVISQGYPNLKYFIVDGGSTDGTVDIIRKYEKQISGWISEPDHGMYDAVNKGYAHGTGEIMGWISGTDILQFRSLFTVASIFQAFPMIEWITGIPTNVDETCDQPVEIHPLQRWSRYRFLAGANRYIQQESTFWRRSLWEKAGSRVDSSRRMSSDFELWVRFFRYARLYSVRAFIGAWRNHDDSLGLAHRARCHSIFDEVIEAELKGIKGENLLRAFRRWNAFAESQPRLRGLWRSIVMKSLYQVWGPDWAPIIEFYHGSGWVMFRHAVR